MINPYDKFLPADAVAQKKLNGTTTGGGWERCSRPVKGIFDTLTDAQALNILDAVENFGYDEVTYDAPRVCTECHANAKFLTGRFRRFNLTRCRECGVDSIIPLNDSGHEITSLEKVLV